MLTELKNRGVQDLLIACVDGLSGFLMLSLQPILTPACIVHMVHDAMKYLPWKDYNAVAADLKQIYKSTTEQEAGLELDQLC